MGSVVQVAQLWCGVVWVSLSASNDGGGSVGLGGDKGWVWLVADVGFCGVFL